MINPKDLKDKYNIIKDNLKNRNSKVDLDDLIILYDKRLNLLKEIEENRQERNNIANLLKEKKDPAEKENIIKQGKDIKNKISLLESQYNDIDKRFWDYFKKIPNFTHPDSPIGADENCNREIKRWGDIPSFDYKPKDHIELGNSLELIDFDTAAKVSGQKFYYLKNEAVLLEFAIEMFVLKKLQSKGFTLIITPDLARNKILEGTGFNPRGAETNIYSVSDSDLCLIGTAEITLGGMMSGRIFEEKELPIYLCGFSHCFRTEAGSHGQFSKGLYRVHQFSKVEMFAFTVEEDSDKIHNKFLEIEEEIYQDLKIPYRVVDICTGDLGGPAYRKYDIEAWLPGRGKGEWGEITSTSNCTDYQSRRLNIKYKPADSNEKKLVHMINGTATAISRTLIAILENYQQEDGSVVIPEVLRKYIEKDIIKR